MFNGHGILELQRDYLDISYREPDKWPSLTPKGSLRALTFEIGDPEAGAGVQLGIMTPVEGETLDWKHSIDPVHHHGSDQFRLISGGEWTLAGRRMAASDFSFQEAGWVYQEHPGADGRAWMALLMGDRRGTEATLKFARDRETLFDAGDVFGVPQGETSTYPHPAGNKGIAAIATTNGPCKRGYLFGTSDDLAAASDGVVTGALGDVKKGPIVHVLKVAPNAVAIPACCSETELVLIVSKGTCSVGDRRYLTGDIRVQRAAAPLLTVTAGSEGLEATLIIADRRAVPVMVDDAMKLSWMTAADEVVRQVVAVPGGARAAAPNGS